MDLKKKSELEAKIIESLKTVFDPEIPVNVYDLGLIYEIIIHDNNNIQLVMTLTNPNCPVAESLISDIKKIVKSVKSVSNVDIKLVFEPPWTKDMISDAALLELGLL